MAVIPPDQLEIREQLGKAVGSWMRRNKWSQQVFHDWALAVGSEGPWNSQISLLLRGKHDPKALFWLAMGRFNEAVAGGDLRQVKDQKLKARILDADPFLTSLGEPATATDFFGMFVGQADIPQDYLIAAELTDEECKDIGEKARKLFRSYAEDQLITPKEAWESLSKVCSAEGITGAQAKTFQRVLGGWADWTPDDIGAMRIDPIDLIKSWAS